MASQEKENLRLVREYLKALENGECGDPLRRFFTPDARQIEFPNTLNPKGGDSDLATLLKRSEQGQKVLRSQTYAIHTEVVAGDRVAVELSWSGVLAIPLGTLAAGDVVKARFAVFFELVDGRIRLQRNYDCFEPW